MKQLLAAPSRQELIKSIDGIFSRLDADRSGSISFHELREGLKKLRVGSSPIVLTFQEFNAMTNNGKLCDAEGEIDEEAFEMIMRQELINFCNRQLAVSVPAVLKDDQHQGVMMLAVKLVLQLCKDMHVIIEKTQVPPSCNNSDSASYLASLSPSRATSPCPTLLREQSAETGSGRDSMTLSRKGRADSGSSLKLAAARNAVRSWGEGTETLLRRRPSRDSVGSGRSTPQPRSISPSARVVFSDEEAAHNPRAAVFSGVQPFPQAVSTESTGQGIRRVDSMERQGVRRINSSQSQDMRRALDRLSALRAPTDDDTDMEGLDVVRPITPSSPRTPRTPRQDDTALADSSQAQVTKEEKPALKEMNTPQLVGPLDTLNSSVLLLATRMSNLEAKLERQHSSLLSHLGASSASIKHNNNVNAAEMPATPTHGRHFSPLPEDGDKKRFSPKIVTHTPSAHSVANASPKFLANSSWERRSPPSQDGPSQGRAERGNGWKVKATLGGARGIETPEQHDINGRFLSLAPQTQEKSGDGGSAVFAPPENTPRDIFG